MTPGRWNMTELGTTPKTHPAPGFEYSGVKALFYEGPPWQGKATRIFAWMGMPEAPRGSTVPGIVLVHGGGATALADWVRLWNERGYAAISMDTCGCVPCWTQSPKYHPWPRHKHAGPPGWGGVDKLSWKREDQWPYHATAAVILGHSLLRAQPGVDASRIGLTGISWGGWLTCLAASIDSRFRFAAPVYGCGFLDHPSAGLVNGAKSAASWLDMWDPGNWLASARMPMLWISGTNDFAFPLPSLQRSYRRASGPRTLGVRVRMAHGHDVGEKPGELRAFADSLAKTGQPLTGISSQDRNGKEASIAFAGPRPIVKAELNYTRATGHWTDRFWNTVPAKLDSTTGRATAEIPPQTAVFYFNLFDSDGLAVSSEHVELKPDREFKKRTGIA